jgi:hypothetical protein
VRLRTQDPQKTLTGSQIDGLMQHVQGFIDQQPLLNLRAALLWGFENEIMV